MPSTPAYAKNCPASDDQLPVALDSERQTAGSHVGNHSLGRFGSRLVSADEAADEAFEAKAPIESVLVLFAPLAMCSAGCAASTRNTLTFEATTIGGFADDRTTVVGDSLGTTNGLELAACTDLTDSEIAASGFGNAGTSRSGKLLILSEVPNSEAGLVFCVGRESGGQSGEADGERVAVFSIADGVDVAKSPNGAGSIGLRETS